mmetsp:Transcript_96801/g.273536  ORF Transcript_96801/g.273536 Transcript_96801/m.273536 type:complete len:331 (-) Transcript_96801:95-1087(-)
MAARWNERHRLRRVLAARPSALLLLAAAFGALRPLAAFCCCLGGAMAAPAFWGLATAAVGERWPCASARPRTSKAAVPTSGLDCASAQSAAPVAAPPPPSSRRCALVGAGVGLAFVLASTQWGSRARAAEPEEEVAIYFGVGDFHRLQHELVLKEALALGRRGLDISSLTGFAGGLKVGEFDRVCYSGFGGSPEYSRLGHAQVVSLSVPEKRLAEFSRLFFDEVAKRRPSESGPEFRPLIGIRKGLGSPVMPLIEKGNAGRFKLVKGEGDEPGAFDEGTVFVYDKRFFPARLAEVYNQFRDDPPERYESDYRALNDILKKSGAFTTNGCP